MTTKTIKDDPRFKFGPPPIQTAEDAQIAYLREEIDEEELKEAVGLFGHNTNDTLFTSNKVEPIDKAFRRTLPGEIFKNEDVTILKVDERLKVAEAKEDVREAAEKASEKVTQNVKPEVDAAEAKNEAAEKAAEKPQEKLDKLVGDLATPDESKTTKK